MIKNMTFNDTNYEKEELSHKEIKKKIKGQKPKFDKYVSPIINMASNFSHATRASVVGQLTEIFKKAKQKIEDEPKFTLESWKKYYKENESGDQRIQDAKNKILEKIKEFEKIISEIDEKIVEEWVEDLIYDKTYNGLSIEHIIKNYFISKGMEVTDSKPEDESKNIDLYLCDIPVQIKPMSYIEKEKELSKIEHFIIYYDDLEDVDKIGVYIPIGLLKKIDETKELTYELEKGIKDSEEGNLVSADKVFQKKEEKYEL